MQPNKSGDPAATATPGGPPEQDDWQGRALRHIELAAKQLKSREHHHHLPNNEQGEHDHDIARLEWEGGVVLPVD